MLFAGEGAAAAAEEGENGELEELLAGGEGEGEEAASGLDSSVTPLWCRAELIFHVLGDAMGDAATSAVADCGLLMAAVERAYSPSVATVRERPLIGRHATGDDQEGERTTGEATGERRASTPSETQASANGSSTSAPEPTPAPARNSGTPTDGESEPDRERHAQTDTQHTRTCEHGTRSARQERDL